MTLQKIASGPEVEEGTCVQIDQTIYLFESKYEDQPDYHSGHRVISIGSSVQSFDVFKKQWSPVSLVPPILEKQDQGKLDELLFLHSGKLFLLLFNRFEGLSLHSLWRFDQENLKFVKHSDIHHKIVPPGEDNTYGNYLKLVSGNQFNIPAPYFIAKLRNSNLEMVIFHLEIATGHTVPEILKRFQTLEPVVRVIDPLLVSALFYQHYIYITLAEHGCGYKWKTDQILKFNVHDKVLETMNVANEPFVLALPRTDFFYSVTDQWYHFGSGAKGPNGKHPVFVLKELSRHPTWVQYELDVDDVGYNDHFLTTDTSTIVTLVKKNSVYQFDVNSLHF
ncbi:unnamed protein product [Bursaphelenchus xylophilus]|uniref:(pine wood nematode) hypothetical protein n=1 Tax=Bursaphelenchus xylophilus TaxID=6326 RepID=A0A1I7SDF7_BURXY|nr:unnamed protein product [Bursaphelenchus xylophilus]CAG9130661.1 unnamed protein product [Bursaphelenchus xylophilus]